MTTITSNGSKWAGEGVDTIEQLLEVLATTPLDPRFEEYGDFAYLCEENFKYSFVDRGHVVLRESVFPKGNWRFFGNFYLVSHVFNIDTTEPELIAKLTEAIRLNKLTEAYQKAKQERLARPKTALARAHKGCFQP